MAFSSAGANAFFDKRDAAREKRRDKEELRREKELDRAFQRENSLFALSLENLKDSNIVSDSEDEIITFIKKQFSEGLDKKNITVANFFKKNYARSEKNWLDQIKKII